MCTKRNIVAIALIGSLVVLSAMVWNVFAESILDANDGYEKSIIWGDGLDWSPAGTWVISVPAPDGPMIMLHTVYPQDTRGARFGGVMWEVNDNPTTWNTFPEGERGGYWATQNVRTGPDTYETTMLGYVTKKHEGPLDQIVTIGICKATWRITGPNTNEGDAVLAEYLAAQDADGDGLPDAGQEPAACMPFTFTCRRLTMVPGCVPTPMPAAATQQ